MSEQNRGGHPELVEVLTAIREIGGQRALARALGDRHPGMFGDVQALVAKFTETDPLISDLLRASTRHRVYSRRMMRKPA